MPKYTLLQMTQDIMNDIDGDEVNSIDDTIESTQIANIIKTTFELMMSNRDWPHTKGLIQLVASGTIAKPTHMTMDPNVKKIESIRYNKIKSGETRKVYSLVRFKNPDDFLRLVNGRDDTDSTVDTVTEDSGVELFIRNDTAPEFYTSFDDEAIVFDAYDSSVDSTLQSAKVQAIGYVIPTFVLADATVADLPVEAFGYLLEESKSKASLKLRQTQDVKAEVESRKQGAWLGRNMWTVDGGVKYTSYGRGRNRTFRSSKETNGV